MTQPNPTYEWTQLTPESATLSRSVQRFVAEAERVQGWCGHVIKTETCADVIDATSSICHLQPQQPQPQQPQQQQHVSVSAAASVTSAASAPMSCIGDVTAMTSSPVAACSPPAAVTFSVAQHGQ